MSDEVLLAARERRVAELEFVEAAFPDAHIHYNTDQSDGTGFSIFVKAEYDAAAEETFDDEDSEDEYKRTKGGTQPHVHVPHIVEEEIVKLAVYFPPLYPESCAPEVTEVSDTTSCTNTTSGSKSTQGKQTVDNQTSVSLVGVAGYTCAVLTMFVICNNTPSNLSCMFYL